MTTAPEVPPELVQAGASGNLLVLVGAGASAGSGLPGLSEVLGRLLARARAETGGDSARGVGLDGADGWFATDGEETDKLWLLHGAMGDGWLRSTFAELLRAGGGAPTPTHRALAALSGTTFATTNVDGLLEEALREFRGWAPRVEVVPDVEARLPIGPGDVLKLRGDVDRPETLVLTHDEENAATAAAQRAWQRRFAGLTWPPWQVLIVGYRDDDPFVREGLAILRGGNRSERARPYWLEVVRVQAWARATALGLRPVWLRGKDETVPWLEALAGAITRERSRAPAVLLSSVAWAGLVGAPFAEPARQAEEAFRAQRYDEALALYVHMLEPAERRMDEAPEDEEVQRAVAFGRVNVGACWVNLGNTVEALNLLNRITDPLATLLPPAGRALLAEGLAQLGEVAQAHARLPSSESARSAEKRLAIAAARQLIEVMDGRPPDGPALSPVVALHACRLLLRQGKLDDAAARLLVLLGEGREHALLTLHALGALEEALEQTVFEEPAGAEPILMSRRREVVEALEDGLRRLDALTLPEGIQRRRETIRGAFLRLTEVDDQRASGQGLLVPRHDLDETDLARGALYDPSQRARAEQLAVRGEFDAAVARLPASDHPWRRRYERTRLLAVAQRLAEAFSEALDLAQTWPGRAPIETLAGLLLHLAQRPDEALDHAQSAFEALPGRGQRRLLGACLLACDQAAEAWEVLEPLRDINTPAVLAARAQAAEGAYVEKAPALWERYLEARPDDAAARLRLALVEARLGHVERAREIAWTAATGPGHERLQPDALYHCADLQFAGGATTEAMRDRIRSIVEQLGARFPVQGEPQRAVLLSALDHPEDAAPMDLDLLQQHGFLIAVHADEAEEGAKEDLNEQLAARRAYRGGQLPFEALSPILRAPAAALFVQALRGEGISLAVRLSDTPAITLSGARILTGELELLLLHHLGLWSPLREALGEGGRLIIFQDVATSIATTANDRAAARERIDAADTRLPDVTGFASSLHAAVEAAAAAGWLEVRAARPAIADLPGLRSELDTPRNRRLLLTPMERALTYRAALANDVELWLTADSFTASMAVGRAAGVLAWSSRESARDFTGRMQVLDDRRLSLPGLVGCLAPGPEGLHERLALAQLGFAGALNAADLHALLHNHGGLDRPEPKRILDGQERLAHSLVHQECAAAQLRIASLYATTIWEAWCSATPLPVEQSGVLSAALLGRAEAIDATARSAVMDLTLTLLGDIVAHTPQASEDAANPAAPYPSATSTAAQLWTALASWAGPGGPRRAAYHRALRQVWLQLDVRSGDDPGTSREATALLLSYHRDRPNLDRDLAAVAILSACWKTPLLEKMFAQFVDVRSGEVRAMPIEPILREGVKRLESASGIAVNDERCRFSFPIPGTPNHLEMVAPTEALLLRASEGAIPRLAKDLAELQGPNDGRAHALLERLAEHPEDSELRRRYARMTIAAPWRLVRETPAILASWHAVRRGALPRTSTQLREILSEPDAPLPSQAEQSLWKLLDARIGTGGPWSKRRRDAWQLVSQAALMPGVLPAFLTRHKLAANEAQYPALVADALYRLDHPDEHPAASLAEAIFFLRGAAAQKPFVALAEGEIDLRERLPERLVSVLRAVRQLPRNETLADVETSLLRRAGRIVRGLADARALALRDRLWLTFRLHQWVCAQLAALPREERAAWIQAVAPPDPVLTPDDLFDPEGFDREREVDHRLITVLYALGSMGSLAAEQGGPRPRSVSSTQLENELSELSARPWTDADRSIRALGEGPSVLDWDAPGAVPDLALLALLLLNREAFFNLPQATRLQWLLLLPRRVTDIGRVPWALTTFLLDALTSTPDAMSTEEAQVFEAWLRDLEEPPSPGEEMAALVRSFRWRGLTALFARGDAALELEARGLLVDHLGSPEAPEVFGRYLMALSLHAPDRLETEAAQILAAASCAGRDPFEFLPALGQVILMGAPSCVRAARAALLAIAARPPFLDDPRARQLLGTLGLR